MIKTNRLKLSFEEHLSHYWIVILMLLGTGFWWYQAVGISNIKTQRPTLCQSFNIGLSFFLIATLFFTLQYRKLRFTEIITICTEKSYTEAIKKTAQKLNWIILTNSSNYCCAFHETRTYLNWGESITIIKTEKGILINSICDPDAKTALFSFGWNRRNINTFINCLEAVIRDKQT